MLPTSFSLKNVAVPNMVACLITKGSDVKMMAKAVVDTLVQFIKFFSELTHPDITRGNLTTVRSLYLFFLCLMEDLCSHRLDQS